MIDFEIPADVAELRDRVRKFVDTEIVPYEKDSRVTAHGPTDELRRELIAKAKAAGLLSVQQRPEGMSHLEQAVIFEAAGWSTLGPVAMNCAAPDEGNMFLLSKVADADQAAEYLDPVVAGTTRSVFAMTEPDGAGSDPSQLSTTAVRDGGTFVINGRKWLITGAVGADTWIIMADVPGEGATLFLCHGDTPGIVIERVMNTMDRNYVEGHCVVRFEDLTLPESSVLGSVGQAFRYAQLRLAPARLTHCMRWLGAASRAQSIAIEHAKTRTSFGKPIGRHQGVGFLLAENEIALQQCRLMIWWACWHLDKGAKARHESSMVKAMVSEELFKVADRCVQVLGGIGISDETPVAAIFTDMRAFRLYDGPTEVHKYAISRQLLRDAAE
ncbi:acyl-CoA dehydrogenase family protein [Nocardia rhizosphaerihabitans]|uniref:Acyl-CoA dehydrogenase n=1 Tax=Nocardia rhizosphaerihabitans TaxID=1691570 RepID=A0ABQ2K3Y4_9NOCA|nr:acyl-CoA dehydrogenase family protein [Nocardia rhizosphaerihabitans]GGN68270.1 putative acyl-CoA dehydrogenase [Nocardia rhizosphaerihabitans]